MVNNGGSYKREKTVNNFFLFEDENMSGLKEWQKKIVAIMEQVPSEADILAPVLQLLVTSIRPAKIYMLNRPRPEDINEIEFIDLLLVISNSVPFAEFEPILEIPYIRNQRISCSLHNEGNLLDGLRNGHIFYSLHCIPSNLIYDDRKQIYPTSSPSTLMAVKGRAQQTFTKSFDKALECKLAADFLRQNFPKRSKIAAFMLHQAAELTFRSIVNSLTEHDIRSHLIRTYKKHIRRCAPMLYDAFPDNTNAEGHLLDKLEEAYKGARYEDYEISGDTLDVLFDRITLLIENAKPVMESVIGSALNNKAIE